MTYRGGTPEEMAAYRRMQAVEQEFLATSSEPESLPAVHREARSAEILDLDRARSTRFDQQARLDQRAEDFITNVESAWSAHRGEIPIQWWYEQNVEDLRMLNDPTLDQIAYDIEEEWYYTGIQAVVDLQVQKELERRAQANVRGQLLSQWVPFLDVEPLDLESAEREIRFGEITSPSAEHRKDEKNRHILNRAAEGIVTGLGRSTSAFARDTGVTAAAGALREPAGLVLEGTARDAMQRLAMIDRGLVAGSELSGIVGWLRQRQEDQAARRLALLQGQQDIPVQDLVDQLIVSGTNEAWEVELTEVERQGRIREAGGDEIQAMGFFAAERLEDPEAREQMAQYVETLRDEQRDLIYDLEEFDFSPGAAVLDLMATYGRNVPMRLATGATLLFSDTDLLSSDWGSVWSDLGEEIEKADFSPAKALGIDGSFQGLMLDLGGGIAFDPFTWFTGPRGLIRAGKPWTAADALLMADSPIVGRYAKDIILNAQNPSKGVGGFLYHLRWADDEAIERIAAIVGYREKMMPAGGWRDSRTGIISQWTEVETLSRLPVLRRTVSGVDENLPELMDDIAARGFDESVEIVVDRQGRVALNDGSRRIAAAQELQLRRAPAHVKFVDDLGEEGALLDELFPGSRPSPNVDDLQTFESRLLAARQGSATDELTSAGDVQRSLDQAADLGLTDPTQGGPLPAVFPGARPDRVLPTRAVLGDLPEEEIVDILRDGIMNRGLVPEGVGKFAHELAWANRLLANAKETGPGEWIQRYAGGYGTTRSVSLSSPHALQDSIAMLNRLFGSEQEAVAPFLQRLLDHAIDAGRLREQATVMFANAKPLREEIYALRDLLGGSMFDDGYRQMLAGKIDELRGVVKQDTRRRNLIRDLDQFENADTSAAGPGGLPAEALEELPESFGTPATGAPEELAEVIDLLGDPRMAQYTDDLVDLPTALENITRVRERLLALESQYDNVLRDLDEIYARRSSGTRRIQQALQDAWDEYNRRFIATNRAWRAHVDPETGMVPWNKLKKGLPTDHDALPTEQRGFFPEDRAAAMEAAEVDGDELLGRLSGVFRSPITAELPLSPLDMVIARSWGGAKWTRFTHQREVAAVRQGAWELHKLWVIDKVFRPATAMTVSFDELLRIWHEYGTGAVTKWLGDHAIMKSARAAAFMNRRNGLRNGVTRGAEFLPARAQERIRTVNNAHREIATAERELFEAQGLEWTTIRQGEAGHPEAARRWTATVLQDDGFRAALRGKDAFREWFNGPGGEAVRSGMGLDTAAGVSRFATADEAFDGWMTVFGFVMDPALKAGKYDEVLEAFRRTAAQIDETSGAALQNLPEFVFNYIGNVKGVRKHLPKRTPVSHLSERFFDNLFMNPVNYRRGLLSDLSAGAERQRLESLFASQGKRIVSDLEVEQILGLPGASNGGRGYSNAWLNRRALEEGMVLESYVNNMVERAVRDDISNTLYTFDQGSRFGQQAKAVFPFGKPWADMAGYWGREILRRPVARGWLNNENLAGLKWLVEHVPFNRTNALLSRLAATDFTIEGGLPGAEETDFSPLFFLPTGGENPFGLLLPGLGFVPTWFLDQWIQDADPVNDPIGYQERVDAISQFIPSARFQQGGTPSRLFGGGVVGSGIIGLTDLVAAETGESTFNFSSFIGDVSREIDWGRQMTILLADPDELEILLSAQTVAEAEVLLDGLAIEAAQTAARRDIGPRALRFVAPASARESSAIGEILDYWVEANERFPEQLPVRPSIAELDLSDPDNRDLYANEVRREFFKLPPQERDLLVAQFPSLAVNLISSWEWTDRAKEAGVPGSAQSYRISGTQEGLSLHRNYVSLHYVRPRNPRTRALQILGAQEAAYRNSVKRLYTVQANLINDVLWAATSEKTKGLMELLALSPFGQNKGFATPREAWEKWGSLQGDFEMWIAGQTNIPTEGEQWEALKKGIVVPGKEQAWSTEWPGPEASPTRFGNFPMVFLEEAASNAAALGIEVTQGMTGEQFHRALVDGVTRFNPAVYQLAAPVYQDYLGERSVEARTWLDRFRQQTWSGKVSEEWGREARDFLEWTERTTSREFEELGGPTLATQQEVVDRFQRLRFSDSGTGTDWDAFWEAAFQRTHGPLEWEPPEPAAPFDEDGNRNADAITPYIVHIPDGDSITFKDRRDAQRMQQVRLLGVRAADFGEDDEGAQSDKERLKRALADAVENGDTIWLVRDPNYTNVDSYGRMLAWLWIGDEPYYFPDDFRRNQDPSRN